MNRYQLINLLYRLTYRPLAFKSDPEKIHDMMCHFGSLLARYPFSLRPFYFKNSSSKKTVLGLKFANPIGLAAGFDYDGYLADVFPTIGFGFNTVGTVTAKAYSGNPQPRLKRLVKSQSILVNKGFKSQGAKKVAARLDQKFGHRPRPKGYPLGISVGSSNLPEINTIELAIDDYLTTFEVFAQKSYVDYFELNISCPNIGLKEPFSQIKNFDNLLKKLAALNLKQPIFVKMPNELEERAGYQLIDRALKYGVQGFIFGNLAKDRNNLDFNQREIASVGELQGNFSGRPTEKNVLKWLRLARQRYGQEIALVGCGGTFNATDARLKLEAVADLVQLITGLIFTGPALASEINSLL